MSVFIGIDVSQDTLDIASLPAGQHLSVPNSPQGFQKLHHWLQLHDDIQRVALEATGRYGEPLAHFLLEQHYPVSYLNPKQTHAFAQVHLHHHKTDRQDAKLIARYSQLFLPHLYQARPELQLQLQQRSRRLHALQKMRQQEKNRLQSGISDPYIKQQLKRHITYLERLIRNIHKAIQALIFSDDTLSSRFDLLCSIKGIGPKTAQLFLAEIDIDRFNSPRKLAAFIGLTPQHFQSGTSVNKRASISKQGNSYLRAGLYMPAVVAKRWNPPCKQLATRLENDHKHNMVIIVALMRKLVHQIYGVLKSGLPFDPDFETIT